jgi:predicted phosphodiesterase
MVLREGDHVVPFFLKPFLALECDFSGVWGNNDGDEITLCDHENQTAGILAL